VGLVEQAVSRPDRLVSRTIQCPGARALQITVLAFDGAIDELVVLDGDDRPVALLQDDDRARLPYRIVVPGNAAELQGSGVGSFSFSVEPAPRARPRRRPQGAHGRGRLATGPPSPHTRPAGACHDGDRVPPAGRLAPAPGGQNSSPERPSRRRVPCRG
jgi:hypothetical protein